MLNNERVINKLKKEFIDGEDYLVLKKNKAVIAGGAITSIVTGKKINDFDIYFRSKENCDDAINYFNKKSEWRLVAQTNNAMTFNTSKLFEGTITMQLIYAEHMFFDNPIDLIKSFDFTINMAAFDLVSGTLIYTPEFITDNMNRQLVFNDNTKYPIVSMSRAIKYIDRGYKLSAYEQIKIALCINNLEIKDYKDLKTQLQGIDTATFVSLTEKLIKHPKTEYCYKDIKEEIRILKREEDKENRYD